MFSSLSIKDFFSLILGKSLSGKAHRQTVRWSFKRPSCLHGFTYKYVQMTACNRRRFQIWVIPE